MILACEDDIKFYLIIYKNIDFISAYGFNSRPGNSLGARIV